MSLKQYTTETLQDDLAALARMWPDGIPEQQTDRVNAIKNELKLRGATLRRSQPAQPQRASVYEDSAAPAPSVNGGEPINLLSDAALDSEYKLAARQVGDDPGNDVLQDRFATLRFEMRKRAKAKAEQPATPPPQSVQPRDIEIPNDVERRVPRFVAPQSASAVRGYVTNVEGGTVMLSIGGKVGDSSVLQLATVLTPDDAEVLAAMINAAATIARNQS